MFKAPEADKLSAYLKSVITNFEGSEERCMMTQGERYYRSDNSKIMARRKLMYARDPNTQADYLVEDPYKANNKLPSGFFKILVDQKVQYSLGKALVVKEEPSGADIVKDLGRDFQTILKRIGKASAKKAIGWAQVYLDPLGAFKLKHMPSEQCIPAYSAADADVLEYMIRYYPVQAMLASGEVTTVKHVEIWDEKVVTRYQEHPDTKEYAQVGPATGHMTRTLSYAGQPAQETPEGWGAVPFIPLINNDEALYDLQDVKNYIDVYDFVVSDFANNLEDIQDVYWVLKGYNGENMDSFLSEVRKYKTLKVSEEGDAKAETVDIPHEARNVMLETANDDIFKFGRGVDTSKTSEGDITNVVIKARFANLDLKASEFETQIEAFIDRLMLFYNRYLDIQRKPRIEDYSVVFNRSQIFNETEILEANAKQAGSISEETRLSNHPWVDDVEEELRRLEDEKPEITIPEETPATGGGAIDTQGQGAPQVNPPAGG